MKIKGTAVQTIPDFIKQTHPTRYNEWFDALSPASQKIFKGMIITNGWFPMSEALVEPLKTTASLFYHSNQETAARTMGRFSANAALTGVYKFFVKIGSPIFLIERSSSLMKTYFDPSEIKVLNSTPKGCTMQITHFPEPDEIIEWNIAGWIERALEISGCKNPKAVVTKSLAKKHETTEICISWN